MPPSVHFKIITRKMNEIHEKKNADYATDSDPFSNFRRAAQLVSWFKDDVDKTFAAIIGIKLARMAELRNGKIPLNESIDDTMIDCANYQVLWLAKLKYDGTNGSKISDEELYSQIPLKEKV